MLEVNLRASHYQKPYRALATGLTTIFEKLLLIQAGPKPAPLDLLEIREFRGIMVSCGEMQNLVEDLSDQDLTI